MVYRIVFVTALLFTVVFFASEEARSARLLDLIASCEPTSILTEDTEYPGSKNIPTTNNLRRSAGSAYIADGKPISIKGRVLDKNCLPVSDAVVEIWHTDAEGKDSSASEDKHFQGTGRAYTNNVGEFNFVTIIPGKTTDSNSPYINFRITHPDFTITSTRMYFSEKEPSATTKFGDIYTFDITLNGENKFRRY